MKWLKKAALMWLVMVLIFALLGFGSAWAAVECVMTTYTTISAEVLTVTEELTAIPKGIDVEDSSLYALGNSNKNAVLMTADGKVANTATTTGHYIYLYELKVETTKAKQVYKVEVFKNGISQGSCYVMQRASPGVNNKVTITWDTGTSLASAVYQIKVTEDIQLTGSWEDIYTGLQTTLEEFRSLYEQVEQGGEIDTGEVITYVQNAGVRIEGFGDQVTEIDIPGDYQKFLEDLEIIVGLADDICQDLLTDNRPKLEQDLYAMINELEQAIQDLD